MDGEHDPELAEIRARVAREMAASPAPVQPAEPLEATDESLPALVAEHPLLLLDCWAAWCGPCRTMEPIVEDLAKEFAGTAAVAKLDVDANPAAAQALQVRGIPVFYIFKDGKAVERLIGAMPKAHLAQALRKWSSPRRTPGPRR